jgi:hypothetical protein
MSARGIPWAVETPRSFVPSCPTKGHDRRWRDGYSLFRMEGATEKSTTSFLHLRRKGGSLNMRKHVQDFDVGSSIIATKGELICMDEANFIMSLCIVSMGIVVSYILEKRYRNEERQES